MTQPIEDGQEEKPDPEKLTTELWHQAVDGCLTRDNVRNCLRTFQQQTEQAATTVEFERLYGKLVALIHADIAGDFDAALDQLEYNVARKAQEAEREGWRELLRAAERALEGMDGGEDHSMCHTGICSRGECTQCKRVDGLRAAIRNRSLARAPESVKP